MCCVVFIQQYYYIWRFGLVPSESMLKVSSYLTVCVCVLYPDIFMNYRGQPTEQTVFADCGYFESSPSTAFAPLTSSVGTAPQLLLDTQLAQVLLV